MTDGQVPDFVVDALDRLGISLSREQIRLLARYLDLLLEANTRVNLTAVRDRDAAWERLIVDSLTVLPGLEILKANDQVVDVGTGGGMPGMPLAIARPDLRFTLVDATGKKVRLIQSWVKQLALKNVSAIQSRAETLGRDPKHRERYDVAVSRALGPLAVVLEYTLPLVTVGGRSLAMKGPKAETELDAASDALATLGAGEVGVFEAYPASFGKELVIISVIKERRTPEKYPRGPGIAKQAPL